MDYKAKYENLINILKSTRNNEGKSGYTFKSVIDSIMTELSESEDEKIRKELIEGLKQLDREKCPVDSYPYLEWASWLEKQGEKKPADKVGTKFKVGDWIVNSSGDVWHIDSFDIKNYQVSNEGKYNYFPIAKQDEMHLWTIQDAKDGDVLYHKSPLTGIEYIVMSRGVNGHGTIDSISDIIQQMVFA